MLRRDAKCTAFFIKALTVPHAVGFLSKWFEAVKHKNQRRTAREIDATNAEAEGRMSVEVYRTFDLDVK